MQAPSSVSSRLQGCRLSLWTVGDLPTVKPEATTTSCKKTQDKKNNNRRNQKFKPRELRDKSCNFSSRGRIGAANIAPWETFVLGARRQHIPQMISWWEKCRLSFVWHVSYPNMASKPPLRADKGTADTLNNHVTETQPDKIFGIYGWVQQLKLWWLPAFNKLYGSFEFHENATVRKPKT